MAQNISRGTCIADQCTSPAFFKRLCRAHFSEKSGDASVKDYFFSWQILDTFQGTVRATSQEDAVKLVKAGIAAGSRTIFGPKPINVELCGVNEC